MENRNYKVYKHTTPSGKVYIGITKQLDPNDRWINGHGYKKNQYFWKAICKYGWDNITHEILHSNLTKAEAELLEIQLINEYNSIDPSYGYNLQEGGNAASPSDETRKKMSEAQKGEKSHFYNVKGENHPLWGRELSTEVKQKISESRKGKCCGENNHNYGKPLSDETKQKLSKSIKKHWQEHDHPMTGKKLSPEHIKKISESRKGKHLGKDNKMSKPILQIDLNTGEIIAEFAGVQEAARETGSSATKISACCVGKRHKHNGYAWCHKESYIKQKDAA